MHCCMTSYYAVFDVRKLQVVSAQRSDDGAYACVASNPAGDTSKEYELNVLGMCIYINVKLLFLK